MAKNLVIVESPAKAKTINKLLGREYVVKASMGHVRDLPPRALGVDVEHGFAPQYVAIKGRAKVLSTWDRTVVPYPFTRVGFGHGPLLSAAAEPICNINGETTWPKMTKRCVA